MGYYKFPISIFIAVVLLFPESGFGQQWRVQRIKEEYKRVPNGVFENYWAGYYEYNTNSNRGSNYNSDTINYDRFYFDNNQPGSYRRTQYFDNQNRMVGRRTEELKQNYAWEGIRLDSFIYSNNRLDTYLLYKEGRVAGRDTLVKYTEAKHTYDTQDLLVKKVTTPYDSKGVPEPGVMINYYEYDSNKQLVKDSVRVFRLGVWVDWQMLKLTYNANGDTLSLETYVYDTAGLKQSNRTVFIYDSNNRLINDTTFSSNSFVSTINDYVYNAQGQLISDTTESFIFKYSKVLREYTYTSFGYFDTVYFGVVQPSGGVHVNFRWSYVYQHHWPVSVNELANNTDKVTLYPNPATSVLHIDSKAGFDNGYIYNNMGQMVKQVQGNVKEVDISQLPVGNYVLQLFMNGETSNQKFVVLR